MFKVVKTEMIILSYQLNLVVEAHPSEEEHFKNQLMQIKSHQTLSDRLEAASMNLFLQYLILIIILKMNFLKWKPYLAHSWLII